MRQVGQQRMAAAWRRQDKLEVSPEPVGRDRARPHRRRHRAGRLARPVAERLQEYQEIGIDTVIGSGYPHLEESISASPKLLFRQLGIGRDEEEGGFLNEFGQKRVFAGGSHGGCLRSAS